MTDAPDRLSTSKLLSATVIMAGGTISSRILGLVRVLLTAYLLGSTTRQADIVAVATTIPNSLYILLAGGALNTVLVPQLVRAVKHDKDGGEAYTNRIMTAFLLILGLLTVVLVLAAPAVTWLYSDQLWRAPELAAHYRSMVLLTTLCLPQVFFYGVFFLGGQILNARDRFGPMMWAPIANNVVQIVVLAVYAGAWGFHTDTSQPFTAAQLLLLGLGSVAGIAAQAIVLVPFWRQVGFRYHPRFDLRHTGLGHTFHLAKWTIGFVAVNQLALMIVSRLATGATAGGQGAGMGAYNNANLLWVLPHSLITVSLATAMLPSLSRLAADHRTADVRTGLLGAIRMVSTIIIPVSLLYLAVGVPIAEIAFRNAGGDLVGWTLVAFALGLIPFSIQYLILRAFYAYEDTRATFTLQLVIAGLNIALALFLVRVIAPGPNWIAPSLALSYTLAYWVGMLVSLKRLERTVPGVTIAAVLTYTARVIVAAVPGVIAAWAVVRYQTTHWDGVLVDVSGLLAGVIVAALLYLVMARVLGLTEISELIGIVLRRRTSAGGEKQKVEAMADNDRGGPGADGTAASEQVPTTRVMPTVDAALVSDEDEPGVPMVAPEPDASVVAPVPAFLDGHHDHPGDTTGDHGTGDDPDGDATPGTDDDAGGTDEEAGEDAVDAHLPGGDVPAGGTPPDGVPVPVVPGLPESGTADEDGTGSHVSPGMVIGDRYRLVEEVDRTGTTVVWRAVDQILSRSVVVTLMAPHDPRASRTLQAARQASAATDARFARVLDAVVSDSDDLGSYLVSEWVDGMSLETLLAGAPLTPVEIAWLVREVAEAIASMHALGLQHQRLSPATVWITPAGNIKITGFLTDAAIRPDPVAEPLSRAQLEARDLQAIGSLMYAALTLRWPGGPAYGMAAAPRAAGGGWVPPAQVKASGVPPTMDRITDQILNPAPRAGAPRLLTCGDIVDALSTALGPADASRDLERRLRAPIVAPVAPVASTAPADQADLEAFQDGEPSATELAEPADPSPTATIAHPTVTAPHLGPRRHRGALILAVIVVLALVGTLIAVWVHGEESDTPGAASTSTAEATVRQIVASTTFDPEADGGNGDENPDQAKLAHDGNMATAWTTLRYRGSAKMGNLKPGVGLLLDLGEAVSVSAVKVHLQGSPTAIEVRIPATDAATVVSPPMTSQTDWTVVAGDAQAGTVVTLNPTAPVTSRFLMLYVTSLPAVSGGFQAAIAEVEVTG